MKINSGFAGLELKPYKIEISLRQAMNYAAAIGDANPAYFDDEQDGGSLAPPMLAVALTWPITSNIWDYLPDPEFPTHLLLTQVHYSEHLQIHQPLRPGMKLDIRGRVSAIGPHRAGALVTLCYQARLPDGSPVFTEYIGGLLRGVACDGPAQGMDALPTVPNPPTEETTPIWLVPVAIDPLASYVYDGCADLHFPIHTSPQFARNVGLPGIVLQGTATLAHACRQLIDRQAGGDPARLQTLACRFGAFVQPGETIDVRLNASRRGAEYYFSVINSANQEVIRHGYAVLNE